MSNIPKMKVKDAVEKLTVCYETMVRSKLPLKDMRRL